MNSKIPPTTNSIPQRELRSKTASSISIQTQARNTNRNDTNDRSKSTTSTPILGRKVTKPSSRRTKSMKSSSRLSKTKKTVTLAENNDTDQPNESDNEMDQDYTEQVAAPNFDAEEIIPNPIVHDEPANQDQNETPDALNESNETVDEDHRVKRKTAVRRQDILQHFTKQKDGSFKCTLCPNSNKVFSKTNEHSDSNLRKTTFEPKLKLINNDEKKTLDDAAIQAIIHDDLPFNHFRKNGMSKFLSIIKPGYRGPNRKYVRNQLAHLYKQHREDIKEKLSSALYVSLTTDVWKNRNRQYFICLTCHFVTTTYENESLVLSFRRFPDRHTGINFRSFIINELKKMNLGSKVCSITTDGGPDIKCATAGVAAFGMRISCCAHDLNLVVQNGLWLFENRSPKKSKSSTTSKSSKQNNDNNRTNEKPSDYYSSDDISEQSISDLDYNSDNSEESDETNDSNKTYVYISSDEELSDGIGEHEDEDINIIEERPSSQPDDNNQCRTDEEIIAELIDDPNALKVTVYNLLQRVRNLIKIIRKSYKLDQYVQNQIQMKKIQIIRPIDEQNTKTLKFNNVIMNFKIRWNTTYVMLERFIAISSVITDITLSPSIQIGLEKEQYNKLRRCFFSHFDWLCLAALKTVLFPFYQATTILSGSKYPTLSLAYSVLTALKVFLTRDDEDQALENALKQLLLVEFKSYFDQKLSWDQKRATLIAAFLNPTTYRLLTDEDLREAEHLLLTEFDIQSFDRLQINPSAPRSTQAQVTSNNTTRQEGSSLYAFYNMCGIPVPSNLHTTSTNKNLSFKEELGHYMSTARLFPNFKEYWCQHEVLLPQLSKFVKRYCCIPATNVRSEAAFSIAGHIQRKSRSSLSSTALRYLMILRN